MGPSTSTENSYADELSSDALREAIIKRLGFFPPFFKPALHSPLVLNELWREMEAVYLGGPIPMLFKEKLSALLARYCRVPYCLVCHTSSLRPLGMSAAKILELLEMSPLGLQDLMNQIDFDSTERITTWPDKDSTLEKSILFCSVASVLDTGPSHSLDHLRKLLSPELYDFLVMLLSYNQTCLTWAESHPELSYREDQRTIDHLGPLLQEEPKLSDFFSNYTARVDAQIERRSLWMSEENKTFAQKERRLRDAAENEKNKQAQLVKVLNEEREKRNQFMATVSHDLRSPLTAAKMAIQRVTARKSSMAPEKVSQLCQDAAGHIDRTDRMIQNILDASRLNFGEDLSFKIEDFDLIKYLSEVIDELCSLFGDRIKVEAPKESILCRCDKEAIYRMVSNLVSNAVKYGSKETDVKVQLREEKERVAISVHNYGPCLSDKEQSEIFLPYQRTKSAKLGKAQGWGLGLTLVKGMANQLGGSLSVSSGQRTGTTFTLRLPLACAPPASCTPAPAREAAGRGSV
jgi:sigma-B regulation protein RsbU (phosphoserine phosphatase)